MRIESRGHQRRQVHIPVKVEAGAGMPLRDGVVLDVSESGARLAISATEAIPDTFTILFSPMGRPFRRCRLVWRNSGQIGVSFITGDAASTFPQHSYQPPAAQAEQFVSAPL